MLGKERYMAQSYARLFSRRCTSDARDLVDLSSLSKYDLAEQLLLLTSTT